jgi:hypothetical protein
MSSSPLHELTAEWSDARVLYPLYAALAREFVIDLPRCNDLEANVEAPPQESVEQARQWLLDVDTRIQVHQLRQFLQTTSIVGDDALRILLVHHVRKAAHSDSDRDKVDFLLVQFFSHCAPSRLEDADVDLGYVAQMLEPVLGQVDLTLPEWLAPLDESIRAANACKGLNALFSSKILESGRKLKASAGDSYFEPVVMVAFARYSFLIRRIFFRSMHQDLNAILDGLRELEHRGIESLDCRRAQFSADEPILRLRMICNSWKVMFHAEYSTGQPLRMLVDLLAVIETALAKSAKATPKTQAAAAGAGSAGTDAPEFEVTSHTPDPIDDTAAEQNSGDDQQS